MTGRYTIQPIPDRPGREDGPLRREGRARPVSQFLKVLTRVKPPDDDEIMDALTRMLDDARRSPRRGCCCSGRTRKCIERDTLVINGVAYKGRIDTPGNNGIFFLLEEA